MAQHSAVRLLSKNQNIWSYYTNMLHSIGFIHIRSDFMVLLMTSNTVNGLASAHLSDLIKTLYPTSCTMLSEYKTPVCAQSYKEVNWLQGFFLSCPFLWNDLPADIRQSDSIEAFFKMWTLNPFLCFNFPWVLYSLVNAAPHLLLLPFQGSASVSLYYQRKVNWKYRTLSPFYSSLLDQKMPWTS